jgi:hypothetical protein
MTDVLVVFASLKTLSKSSFLRNSDLVPGNFQNDGCERSYTVFTQLSSHVHQPLPIDRDTTPNSTIYHYTPFTAYSGSGSLATPTPSPSQFTTHPKRPYYEDGDENYVPEVADGTFSLQKKDAIHLAKMTRRN